MTNHITFWGVRGSIATPGPRTARVGGNTSCVEVVLGGRRFILDAGTGLRPLGAALASGPVDAQLLFGHLHWDHIQGLPFFGPLFDPRSRLGFVGPVGLERVLAEQMSGPTFPVAFGAAPAERRFREIVPGEGLLLGPVFARTVPLRHPGGGLAWRLEHRGRSVVYAVDTEPPATGCDEELRRLACGADVLILDAQYLPEEYGSKVGWGHGTFERAAELARAAGVRQLVLTHHDPGRDDFSVARLERRARGLFVETRAAREGWTIELEALGAGCDGETGGRPTPVPLAAGA